MLSNYQTVTSTDFAARLHTWLRSQDQQTLIDIIARSAANNETFADSLASCMAADNLTGKQWAATVLDQTFHSYGYQDSRQAIATIQHFAATIDLLASRHHYQLVCDTLTIVIPQLGQLYEITQEYDLEISMLAENLLGHLTTAWRASDRSQTELTHLLTTWQQADDYGLLAPACDAINQRPPAEKRS